MSEPYSVAAVILPWAAIYLHGVAPSTPVPHWVVLFAVVPALWLLIGGTVLAVDRLLQLFGV